MIFKVLNLCCFFSLHSTHPTSRLANKVFHLSFFSCGTHRSIYPCHLSMGSKHCVSFLLTASSSENYRSPNANERMDGDGNEEPDIYKRIQLGADIPIRGLQKAAPDKNKSEYLDYVVYLPTYIHFVSALFAMVVDINCIRVTVGCMSVRLFEILNPV